MADKLVVSGANLCTHQLNSVLKTGWHFKTQNSNSDLLQLILLIFLFNITDCKQRSVDTKNCWRYLVVWFVKILFVNSQIYTSSKNFVGEKMNNQEKYDQAFKESFAIEDDALGEQLTYQSIPEWDSVGHMGLMAALEDAFDIMIEMEDVIDFGSYEIGKTMLKKYEINIWQVRCLIMQIRAT